MVRRIVIDSFIISAFTPAIKGLWPSAGPVRRSLALFRETGDDWFIAIGFFQLGETVCLQGHYAEADGYLADGLAISRRCGDKGLIAYVLRDRGDNALRQGKLERAVAFYAEALTLASALNARAEIIDCIDGLGLVACERGIIVARPDYLGRQRPWVTFPVSAAKVPVKHSMTAIKRPHRPF